MQDNAGQMNENHSRGANDLSNPANDVLLLYSLTFPKSDFQTKLVHP